MKAEIDNIKNRVREHYIKSRDRVNTHTPPRYDDVFYLGVEALNNQDAQSVTEQVLDLVVDDI